MELSGTVITPQGPVAGRLSFGERVEGLEPMATAPEPRRFILPGFIDLHVHGGGGADTMEGEAAVRQLARFHAQHGTTTLLATTVTAPVEEIEAALRGARAVVERPAVDEAQVVGVHLEGPFISPRKLGAQPPYPLLPDLELVQRFCALAPIRIVTLAAELPGALELIRWLAGRGVRVQQGHTTATYAEALAAFEAGARGFTHLFNAMTPLVQREPGVVGLSLERARYAEVIGDGLHVHPAVLRGVLRAIPGLYVVTDAVAAAGMPEGEYRMGRHAVYRKGEGVYLADGALAGSSLTLDRALRNLVGWGLPLEEAAQRVSTLAAEYLGLEDRGRIAVGARADLVVLNAGLEVEEVYIRGERVR
ncbi:MULTISPECIES: N-acetylglucosamine-6-phosphate deacetylase [unclassified Meiothermus]|uniref:N-acetylglucosamine-6-phosphate deacetylase n=1 Tax=unclassified Meiothermus TaxID=370471 RepID=UPI000D7C869E|nr:MULTISPECIES: N-acetylglucosamine-6-phosphate deacetylase [unclassified Meiothermus]PZA06281.1 N-acetylglucosamine-6-phosphate deacetylase [Meiothermus sp. Pnk-1]RYM36391.1 N-acetylglucosamine-6-phosphate deacetylase [Meiothermus sp. PNK-Is4]